jgi:hypothetical protein
MTLAASLPEGRPVVWERKTRAEELRLQLADEIVRGALFPGAPLDEITLADRFRVSRTPVREAIRLLAASGLVEVRAHRAAVVARPSAKQLAGRSKPWLNSRHSVPALPRRMTRVPRRALRYPRRARVMIQSGDRSAITRSMRHSTALFIPAPTTPTCRDHATTRARVQPFRRANFATGRLAKSHIEHDRVVRQPCVANNDAASAMYTHIVTVRDEYETTRSPFKTRQSAFARAPERAPTARLEIDARADGQRPLPEKPSRCGYRQLDRADERGIGTAATSWPKVRLQPPDH